MSRAPYIFSAGPFGPDETEATARVSFQLSAEDVELWCCQLPKKRAGKLTISLFIVPILNCFRWPNEYGEQALYDLSVDFTPNGAGGPSTVQQRVGFRREKTFPLPHTIFRANR